MSDTYKANWAYLFGDGTAYTIAIGSIADMLPPIAALLSIIWLSLRIYDDPLVKRLAAHLCRKLKRSNCEDPDASPR